MDLQGPAWKPRMGESGVTGNVRGSVWKDRVWPRSMHNMYSMSMNPITQPVIKDRFFLFGSFIFSLMVVVPKSATLMRSALDTIRLSLFRLWCIRSKECTCAIPRAVSLLSTRDLKFPRYFSLILCQLRRECTQLDKLHDKEWRTERGNTSSKEQNDILVSHLLKT